MFLRKSYAVFIIPYISGQARILKYLFQSRKHFTCTDIKMISQDSQDPHGSTSAPDIVFNIINVQTKLNEIASKCNRDPSTIRLVAVSKTKPVEDIRLLYDFGHRHFGENYFQEIVDKAAQLPSDISWHFIGHLQSQKASKLIREVPNLSVLETVDSLKLALKLHNACVSANRSTLNIFLQVHTSDEETKSGVSPDELGSLVAAITTECPKLHIKGLMTIGAPNDYTCFEKLVACRKHAAEILSVPEDSLELSMGMSGDFPEAIERGATSVRVGSTIFGARIYPNQTVS